MSAPTLDGFRDGGHDFRFQVKSQVVAGGEIAPPAPIDQDLAAVLVFNLGVELRYLLQTFTNFKSKGHRILRWWRLRGRLLRLRGYCLLAKHKFRNRLDADVAHEKFDRKGQTQRAFETILDFHHHQ